MRSIDTGADTGTGPPVRDEVMLRSARPDFMRVLPWNLRAEIAAQLDYIGEWGGRLVTAASELRIG